MSVPQIEPGFDNDEQREGARRVIVWITELSKDIRASYYEDVHLEIALDRMEKLREKL